ncbi:MAG: hypothetical protein H6604_09135 [Flavobacteriales bacterium]|nr:hypothetical protein [Flavobacteriales bacterium]
MKKILFLISILFFGLLIAFLVTPYFIKPKSKAVEEYTFDVPVEKLIPYFSNMKKFNEWNYWAVADSNIEITYFFPYKGERSSFEWKSEEPNIGKGLYKIKKIIKNDSIKGEFLFDEYENTVQSLFVFSNKNEKSTSVSWIIYPPQTSYFGRIYNLYVENYLEDKMHGGFIELDNILKGNSSRIRKIKENLGTIAEVANDTIFIYGIQHKDIKFNAREIQNLIISDSRSVRRFLQDSIQIPTKDLGNPIAFYEEISPEKIIQKRYSTTTKPAQYNLFIGYQINNDTIKTNNEYSIQIINPQKCMTQYSAGNYKEKSKVKEKFETYYFNKGKSIKNFYWEEYQNLNSVDSLTSELQIFQPLK